MNFFTDRTRAKTAWLLPLLLLMTAAAVRLGPAGDLMALPSRAAAVLESPWTLVTYGFVHRTVWHLAVSLALLVVILRVSGLGGGTVWGLFLGGTVTGGLVFLLRAAGAPSGGSLVGASAGICALLPVTLLRTLPAQSAARRLTGRLLLVVALGDAIAFVLTGTPGFPAHLGGYLAGLPVFARDLRRIRRERSERQARAAALDKAGRSGIGVLTSGEKRLLFGTHHD